MIATRYYELSNGDELRISDLDVKSCRNSHELDNLIARRLEEYNRVRKAGYLRTDPPIGSLSMRSRVPVLQPIRVTLGKNLRTEYEHR